jgi:subtilisin family serine protease
MSFGGSYENNLIFKDEIERLYNEFGVIFVASAGNKDHEEYLYPASFDEVISVGGIFDDPDGYLTRAISKRFNIGYSGSRVTDSKVMEYSEYWEPKPENRPFGSTYNDKIDFVAPMYDLEFLAPNNLGNQPGTSDVTPTTASGTSGSAPMVAGVAALVFHTYYKKFGREPTPQTIYEVLKQTAETQSIEHETPKPVIRGKAYDVVRWNKYVGWGCIDAYDAILYVMEKLGG